MWEREAAEVERKLINFRHEFIKFGAFLAYFERTWVQGDRIKFWTVYNQPQIQANTETNNYVKRYPRFFFIASGMFCPSFMTFADCDLVYT